MSAAQDRRTARSVRHPNSGPGDGSMPIEDTP